MNKLALLSSVVLSSGLTFLIACSDDPAPTPQSTSSGNTSSSSSSSGGSSSSSSSSGGTMITCATYTNKTPDGGADAGALAISWTLAAGSSFDSSAPLCWQVKVGTQITFTANDSFTTHPLETVPANQAGNPLSHPAGGANPFTVTMTTAGEYGFQCGNTAHQSVLRGKIKVVP